LILIEKYLRFILYTQETIASCIGSVTTKSFPLITVIIWVCHLSVCNQGSTKVSLDFMGLYYWAVTTVLFMIITLIFFCVSPRL